MLERGRANVRESSSSSSSVWTFFPLLFFFTFSERKVPQNGKRKENETSQKEERRRKFPKTPTLIIITSNTLKHIPSERAIFTTIASARRTARCESTGRVVRFFFRALVSLSLSLSFSLCVCVCVCVSRVEMATTIGSFFLLSKTDETTLKNQKNQSRNTNALVTKINQRRRLSLRLFVHDDIDAFPSR